MLDIRLKLRSALLGFEHSHLQDQSLYAAQQIARQHRADAENLETIIKDVLTGISDCSPAARRLRYRLTAYVYEQAEHIGVVPQLPLTLKRITVSICSESTAANVEDLAGLARALASAVIQVQGRDPAIATHEDWLWTALIAPLSRSATKCPSNEATATGSTVLCAALSVCTDWPEYAPATAAIRLALKAHLQFLSPGSPSAQVAQVFLPVQLAVAALSEGMSAATVTSVARVGLWGLTCKESWQVRKEAADTIAVLVKSVLQDSRDAAPGQYVLEGQQAALVIALQKVKYDKIQHVRHAVGRALAQLALAGKPGPAAVPVPVTRSSMKASSARVASAASSGARSSCSESTASEKAPPMEQPPVSATTEHFPRRTLQNRGKPTAPVPMVNEVKKPAAARQRFVRPTGKMQQQTLDFGVELFLPVTPPAPSPPSVPTLDLALLPPSDTRSVSAPGDGSEAQGHAARQSVADRDVLIADQEEGELDQPEVEPPICSSPAALMPAAEAFPPSSAARSTVERSTHGSADLERVSSSPSRRALKALQPAGSGLDPGHRAGCGDGEITEDGIRLRMRPEVGELEVHLTESPETRPMSSLRARLVHGATGPELRVCLAMGASKSEPAILRHYTCAAGVIRHSSEIATAAAAVPPSPTQPASTPAIAMQSNSVAGASPSFKGYHSPPSKPDHAAEQGETTSGVLKGVPAEEVLLREENAEFTAQLTSPVAAVITPPRGLAWEVALNRPCVPHPVYSPNKAAKNGVGLQQNHAAIETSASNAFEWHQGTARGGSPERGAFPPSSEASQGPGGAHYATSRDIILDAAFMAEDSTPEPLLSTSPRLPSRTSQAALQLDVPSAPVLPRMGTLDRLERLMKSVGGESSELSALRVRIAAAVRRARTSGGALSGSNSAVSGSQHSEGLEPEISEDENGGNAVSQMGDGVDAENDRSFLSAFDELSMGDCSERSSLHLSSQHYAQGQDIFCNPLWDD